MNEDSTVRKLTKQEGKMLKEAWLSFAKGTPYLIRNQESGWSESENYREG